MSAKGDRVMREAFKWFNFTFMIVYCITLLFPLIWMLYTSFKPHAEYVHSTFALQKQWTFSNYIEAFQKLKMTITVPKGTMLIGIDTLFFNSIIRSVGGSLLVILCTACVAYLVATYNFIGKNFIYSLGIVIMTLPIIGSLPAALTVHKALGTYDNMLLHILVSPSNIFGMNFLILYGVFKGLPKAYAESAQIDGAGHYMIFLRIFMPMAATTCVVLFVLQFLNSWNDYLTPMIWLPSYPNLAYGMYYFERNAAMYEATIPVIMSGFVIILLPTSALYISLQKLIVQKFAVGGLKG